MHIYQRRSASAPKTSAVCSLQGIYRPIYLSIFYLYTKI